MGTKPNKTGIRLATIALLAASAIWTTPACHAQSAQGSILGHVTDPTGAAVVNGTVTVKNLETGVETSFRTTSSGDYVFPHLNPGTYTVRVAEAGFQKQISSGLIVEVNQSVRQDFKLLVASASAETVTVTSDAQMLQTDNITVGQVIDGKMMENVPLNGRDFTNLLQIGVGTTITPGGIQGSGYVMHGLNTSSSSGSGGFQEVSVNGAHADSISYSVDGINDTDFFFSAPTNIPAELAIDEFKIENGQYGAMGGQGSVQVNVAIKSGTNQLRGAAYEYLQNDLFMPDNQQVAALNKANGTSNNTKLPFKQNQFGGILGGPVTVPHLYNGKDKSFWFFAYDGGRRHQAGKLQGAVVPNAQELAGDFSDFPYPIYDPLTTGNAVSAANPTGRTQFVSGGKTNVIPQARIAPMAKALSAYFTAPNQPNCTIALAVSTGCYNYIGHTTSQISTDKEALRVDQNLGRDRIYATALFSREDDINSALWFGQGGKSLERSRLFGLTWQRTITSNLINQATAGYNRQHFFTGQQQAYGADLSTLAGFSNVPKIPAYFDVPSVSVGPYQGFGGDSPYEQWDNVYELADTVTWVHGHHVFNVGMDIRNVRLKDRDSYGAMGSISTNGEYTAANPSNANGSFANADGGNGLADFLLGQLSGAGGPPPLGSDLYWINGNNFNLFAQDDYHLTERLTLNLGLRWERPTSFHSLDNSGTAFNPAGNGQMMWADKNFVKPILAAGGNLNYLGCCVSNQLVPLDKKNFAPRIGFSYRPEGLDKLAIRGGYGLYYDTYNRFYDGTQFDENQLYTLNSAPITSGNGTERVSPVQLQGLWATPLTAVQAFSLPAFEGPVGQIYWPENHTPYNQQWSLGFQYAVRPDLLLDANYLGSHGIHEATQLFVNAASLPKVAGDPCNHTPDASVASAACLADPNFQSIQSRVPWKNMPSTMYANANLLFSTYNSFQFQLIQRPVHGLSYHLNYTWSKSLDVTSAVNNVRGENAWPQDPHNLRADYGLAASDQTHRVVATYTYELPTGAGHMLNMPHLNWLIGGWTTSGIYQIASGFPFGILGGAPQDQMTTSDWWGNQRIRANSTMHRRAGFHPTNAAWFDTTEYSTPVAGTYGNSPKSPERTPYFTNLDASFGKVFHVYDKHELKYRLEIFNLGSTWHSASNLLEPDASVPDANFGSLYTEIGPQYGKTNLWAPHTIQMGLQYNF